MVNYTPGQGVGPAGAYHPHHVFHAQRQNRKVFAPVIALLVLTFLTLVALGIVVGQIGLLASLGAGLAAIVPVIPVIATFLWVDRWEPEPPSWLLLGFLWGAGISVVIAFLVNSTVGAIAEQAARGSGEAVGAVISAPIVEEGAKGLFLLGLLLFKRRELDGVVDGIVYAGVTAAGFAFTENVLYFGRAMLEADQLGTSVALWITLVMRGVLSPFAHPLFTAMTGIGIGIAAITAKPPVRFIAPIAGYLGAVLLHGLWNGSATFGFLAFVLVYIVLMVPLFGVMIGVVVWQRKRERRTLSEQLPGMAQAGWIAPQEVLLLADLKARKRWLRGAKAQFGPGAGRAVRDYQSAATELAFLRARVARRAVGPQAQQWHGELLTALHEARQASLAASSSIPSSYPPPPGGWHMADVQR